MVWKTQFHLEQLEGSLPQKTNQTRLALILKGSPIYEIIDGHELNILYSRKNVIPVEEYLLPKEDISIYLNQKIDM